MKNKVFKSLYVSVVVACLALAAPSHAMMKRFAGTARIAYNSLHKARVLQAFVQTHVPKPTQSAAALAIHPHASTKIFWPYLTLALAAADAANVYAEEKTDEQVWLEKSEILLQFSVIERHQMTSDDLELFNRAFAYRGFTFNVGDFNNYTCIRAHIVTQDGLTIAAIALYAPDPNYPERVTIQWLATHPDHQKKGLANALINRIAHITHATVIRLDATQEAYDFYLHIGFKPVPETCRSLEKEFK